MRHDLLNQVSSKQVFTTSSAVSTDSIPKKATQDISIGSRMVFGVYCNVSAGGSVTATSYLIEAIGADDEALTSNVVSLGSRTVLGADLKAGLGLEVPIGPYAPDKEFLGIRVTTTGGTLPTVTLSAYLMKQGDVVNFKAFPKVVNAAL